MELSVPVVNTCSIVSASQSFIEQRNFAWDDRLATKNGYPQANKLIPQYGKRLLQIGLENTTFFYDDTIIDDWFGPGRYRSMMGCDALACNALPGEELEKNLHHLQK